MDDSDGQCVDVLIVSWNTGELLRLCLTSLGLADEAEELNIVVVDNGSVDGSADVVSEFTGTTLIANAGNEGFARANNQGFKSTSSPYVLLLNSDTEVEATTIAHCRDYLASHPEVGVVGPTILNSDGTSQNSVFRFPSLRGVVSTSLWLAQAFPKSPFFNHDRYGTTLFTEPTSVDVVMGSFLMVRRSDHSGDLLDDGFFMYAEEADLCRRVRESGLDVRFLPDVSVRHVKGASSRTSAQRAWSDEAKKRAVLRYIRKWEGLPSAYAANAVMMAGMIPRSVGWAAVDLIRAMSRRPAGQILKGRAAAFHLKALMMPWIIGRRFHGPQDPEVATADRPARSTI